MSLWHFADSLIYLKQQRHEGNNRDLTEITENYHVYIRNLLQWVTRASKGKIKTYVLKRIMPFQWSLMLNFQKDKMPGEDARNQWWGDPLIQEAVERRRR